MRHRLKQTSTTIPLHWNNQRIMLIVASEVFYGGVTVSTGFQEVFVSMSRGRGLVKNGKNLNAKNVFKPVNFASDNLMAVAA